MMRHVVMFRWKEGVEPAHAAATAGALRRLPALIPQIVEYACGTDLGVAPTNFDFAVSARFASLDDYITYRDHPEHQAVVQSMIGPFVAERSAVQFDES
jgi:hypothetical protein